MKNVLKLFAIVFLFQSFQCEEDNDNNRNKEAQFQTLQNDKQEILDYIASIACDATSGCDFIAFGSKPCGGPWEYLVYSNAVDQSHLTEMVNAYNELEHAYNIEFEIFSDCAVVNPPQQVDCRDGICTIIN